MIKEFVEAWNKNKNKLEKYFKNTKQVEYCDYEIIVTQLFKRVINPYLMKTENIEYPLSSRI